MKLQAHANELETNTESESHDFSIGDAGTIIEILRNRLYTNKIATPVQEIISNGRDACREAKKKDNDFDITIPTRLNPVFSVRDRGIGLTPERVKDVFVRYGSSTKRNSNTMTGGFGLGSKSFWAYTDSFSVVTYLDGIRRSYVAHIGVNNQGRLDLVSTDKTTEENGTEVSVAVKSIDIDEFRNAVFRTIYFWEKKPKLKGELNPPVLAKGHRIGGTEVVNGQTMPEYCRINTYGNEMLAVIDGVPYPLPQKLIEKVPNLKKLSELIKREVILHFGNGIVEVSASRESIADSKRTTDSLNKLAGRACLEVCSYISDAFSKVTDTAGYLNTYAKMSPDFEVDKFAKFGAYEIESGWIKSDLLKKVRMTHVSCLNRRGRRIEKVSKTEYSDGKKQIKIEHLNNLFYATVAEGKIQQNKRIREYLKSYTQLFIIEPMIVVEYDETLAVNGQVIGRTVKSRTIDQTSFDQVLSDLGVKDFQTITYVEEPKETRPEKVQILRENEEFCYSQLGWGRYQYTTLAKNTQKWLYVPLDGGAWGYDTNDLRELSDYLAIEKGFKICGLAARAIKMVDGDKNYSPLKDWLANYEPSKKEVITAKWQEANHKDVSQVIAKLKDIKDKVLIAMGEEYKAMLKDNGTRFPSLIVDKIKKLQEVKDFKERDAKFGQLIKSDYPLLNELGGYCSNWKELSFYVNAKYSG